MIFKKEVNNMIWIILLLVCILIVGVVLVKREKELPRIIGVMLVVWSLSILAELIRGACV